LPDSLDVIFTFAGESGRITYSKQLFTRYQKSIWVLSYPGKKIIVPLAREGFDTSRITVVDTCRNTASEVAYILSLTTAPSTGSAASENRLELFLKTSAVRHHLKVGLVSNPYHMRRIRMMATRKKEAGSLSFYYLPVPYEYYGWTKRVYEKWWESDELRPAINLELKKLAYYSFKQ
jgi:uncharacterized SAM-binding protein YcdF (DUF218 family)